MPKITRKSKNFYAKKIASVNVRPEDDFPFEIFVFVPYEDGVASDGLSPTQLKTIFNYAEGGQGSSTLQIGIKPHPAVIDGKISAAILDDNGNKVELQEANNQFNVVNRDELNFDTRQLKNYNVKSNYFFSLTSPEVEDDGHTIKKPEGFNYASNIAHTFGYNGTTNIYKKSNVNTSLLISQSITNAEGEPIDIEFILGQAKPTTNNITIKQNNFGQNGGLKLWTNYDDGSSPTYDNWEFDESWWATNKEKYQFAVLYPRVSNGRVDWYSDEIGEYRYKKAWISALSDDDFENFKPNPQENEGISLRHGRSQHIRKNHMTWTNATNTDNKLSTIYLYNNYEGDYDYLASNGEEVKCGDIYVSLNMPDHETAQQNFYHDLALPIDGITYEYIGFAQGKLDNAAPGSQFHDDFINSYNDYTPDNGLSMVNAKNRTTNYEYDTILNDKPRPRFADSNSPYYDDIVRVKPQQIDTNRMTKVIVSKPDLSIKPHYDDDLKKQQIEEYLRTGSITYRDVLYDAAIPSPVETIEPTTDRGQRDPVNINDKSYMWLSNHTLTELYEIMDNSNGLNKSWNTRQVEMVNTNFEHPRINIPTTEAAKGTRLGQDLYLYRQSGINAGARVDEELKINLADTQTLSRIQLITNKGGTTEFNFYEDDILNKKLVYDNPSTTNTAYTLLVVQFI